MPQSKGLLTPSAFDSPRSSFQDYPLDSASQSGYSRRPSATTVPISELSSRRNSESTFNNSAYNTPALAPLLGGRREAGTRNGERLSKQGTNWSNPREWRRATWVKIVVWLSPLGLLLFVLLHHQSPLRPSLETVAKLRQQINSILHSSASSYTCPSPLLGRPTNSFDDPTTFTRFESIKSNSTDFALAISYSTTTCNSFRIRVSRTNPAVCLHNLDTPQRLNEDPQSTEWIAKLGPDTFQLRVDGAERYVVDEPSKYDAERCEWYFDFPLANSGTVWLNGIHFYENYDTYNSNPHHDIERLLNPLFSTPLQLSLGGSKCTPYVSPLLAQPLAVFPASKGDSFDSRAPSLSICSGSAPIPGSYVPSAYPSLLYPPYQLPQTSIRPSAGYYTWVPSRCRMSHDGLRFRGKHESCLREENKVLFIGDSHTRGLYDVILKRLNGSDEMALTSFKVANKWEKIGNLDLEFLWDPFLEATFDCEYMSRFTHVVISTGSHQACYRCPTTESYISHMSSIFSSWPKQISQCSHSTRTRSKPVEFVFVTNPSWYPQKIERYDCRTQQRLTRWNELATEAALENNWSVVDAQDMTRSMAIDTRMIDGVHYIKTDAIDPMADELLMKLKICGDEAGGRSKLDSERMLG
ncbi:hypothetical protein JCM5353_001107 [Sporobolomyces roseus]